jgi:hypothetical protein
LGKRKRDSEREGLKEKEKEKDVASLLIREFGKKARILH